MRTVFPALGLLAALWGRMLSAGDVPLLPPAAPDPTNRSPAAVTGTVALVDTNLTYLPGARWPVGERLVYRIYWGIIPVGLAVASTEWTENEGRRLLRIRFRTKTNKVLAKLYPVDDSIESLVDPETFLPVRFEKNLSEGSHRYNEVTTFDHAKGEARWESKRSGRTKTFPIRPDTRDIPSFMYYMRSHEFKPGSREHFVVMADDKTYDLWVNVQKWDTTDLPVYGDVPCFKAEPEAAFEGLFVRKGRLFMWASRDERCIATRIVVNVPVATAKVILFEVQGPGDDEWVRKSQDYRKNGGDTPDKDLGL